MAKDVRAAQSTALRRADALPTGETRSKSGVCGAALERAGRVGDDSTLHRPFVGQAKLIFVSVTVSRQTARCVLMQVASFL